MTIWLIAVVALQMAVIVDLARRNRRLRDFRERWRMAMRTMEQMDVESTRVAEENERLVIAARRLIATSGDGSEAALEMERLANQHVVDARAAREVHVQQQWDRMVEARARKKGLSDEQKKMLKRFGAETEYQARMAGSWEVKEKALKAMDAEHRYYERLKRFGGPRT
jgi:hypothetical protein